VKIRELQEKDQRYLSLKQAADRNEKILKKQMDENQTLKRNAHSGRASSAAETNFESPPKRQAAQRDFKTLRAQRKGNAQAQLEDFNQKFLTDLQGQIDDMFEAAATRKERKAAALQDKSVDQSTDISQDQKESEGAPEDTPKEQEADVAEKEALLAGVRQYAMSMSSDIKDLLKNEWAGSIDTLEGQKRKAETDMKENIKKASHDAKLVANIEKEHKSKMDSLNKEVQKLESERKKKENSVAKQIAMQETRIKALEADLNAQKHKREEVERAKKYDENRFFKFKENV